MAHLIEWVIDFIGVLKNSLNMPPVIQFLVAGHRAQIVSPEGDLSRGQRGETQNQVGQGRFSTAALSGNGDDLGWFCRDGQIEIL